MLVQRRLVHLISPCRSFTSLAGRLPATVDLKRLLVLDFEATCGDAINNEREIIEFPTILYDLRRKRVDAVFHEYVRPMKNPVLTDFCTSLTGITQDIVNNADTFPNVWSRYLEFLKFNRVMDDLETHSFVTCGNWDLQFALPEQIARTYASEAIATIPTDPFGRWINIKREFGKYYGNRYSRGMTGMLRRLDMELEGRHHSGIDDCRNILRVVQRMIQDGWKPR